MTKDCLGGTDGRELFSAVGRAVTARRAAA